MDKDLEILKLQLSATQMQLQILGLHQELSRYKHRDLMTQMGQLNEQIAAMQAKENPPEAGSDGDSVG